MVNFWVLQFFIYLSTSNHVKIYGDISSVGLWDNGYAIKRSYPIINNKSLPIEYGCDILILSYRISPVTVVPPCTAWYASNGGCGGG